MAASRSTRPTTPVARFVGLRPSSARASRTASAASRKRDTKCELVLRRQLWRHGLRYRVDVTDLPGRPDVVFVRARVVVFCDGDFWHGRNFDERVRKLKNGHNAPYWVLKITSNVARDRRHDQTLADGGWLVLRFWESDIHRDAPAIAARVAAAVAARTA